MFAALSDDIVRPEIENILHGFIALAPVVFLSKVTDKMAKFGANHLAGLLKIIKSSKIKHMMFSKCNKDTAAEKLMKKICNFTLTKGICTNQVRAFGGVGKFDNLKLSAEYASYFPAGTNLR